MHADDQPFQTTLDRIAWFQKQLAHLRKTETNPTNYRASVSGFMAEIDPMPGSTHQRIFRHRNSFSKKQEFQSEPSLAS